MPCYDSRNDYHDSGESWIARAERLEKRTNELSALLCEAMRLLEQTGRLENASRKLRDWWKEHREFDLRRGVK